MNIARLNFILTGLALSLFILFAVQMNRTTEITWKLESSERIFADIKTVRDEHIAMQTDTLKMHSLIGIASVAGLVPALQIETIDGAHAVAVR